MVESGKPERGRGHWIWICIGIVCVLCVLVLAGLIVFPYFATKPLSKKQLMEYLPTPTPQPPQAAGSPSPAASPSAKKR